MCSLHKWRWMKVHDAQRVDVMFGVGFGVWLVHGFVACVHMDGVCTYACHMVDGLYNCRETCVVEPLKLYNIILYMPGCGSHRRRNHQPCGAPFVTCWVGTYPQCMIMHWDSGTHDSPDDTIRIHYPMYLERGQIQAVSTIPRALWPQNSPLYVYAAS